MTDNLRITASLSRREWELVAYAVAVRLEQLRERARSGDHQAAHLAEEYTGLNEQTQRINSAVKRQLAGRNKKRRPVL